MAFRRRYRLRRKRGLKRKFRRRVRRVPRPLGRVHSFVRGYFIGTITAVTTGPTYGGYSFKLSDCPDYSEFTNLFDEYMIKKITIRFMPVGINTADTSTYHDGWFITVVDKDDDAAPASYNTLLQYPGVRFGSFIRPRKFSFYPRVSTMVYNGGVTTGYGTKRMFLDCSNASIPHYGVKYALAASGSASSVAYDVWVQMVVLCRGVR